MTITKKVKVAAIVALGAAWLVGLVSQRADLRMVGIYLIISGLMFAVSLVRVRP